MTNQLGGESRLALRPANGATLSRKLQLLDNFAEGVRGSSPRRVT
jgi:hypothetical protein